MTRRRIDQVAERIELVTGGRVLGGEVKCSGAAYFRLSLGYIERDRLDGLAQAITQALDWPVRCAFDGRGVCVEVMAVCDRIEAGYRDLT